MAIGGLALKGVSWFLRIIEFCCAAIILGIFSYFLAVLSRNNLPIATYIKAVEGIAGAGVLYTVLALLLVCCLGGFAFFSAIAMVLDFCFAGAFAYLAYATRGGRSCSGSVYTPLGSGNVGTQNSVPGASDGTFIRLPSLYTACRLNTACFAVAIIGAVFFLLSIPIELALIRHRKKEKAFGPSPNNGYTAGSPKRKFWQRRRKARDAEFIGAEKHPDALPAHTQPAAVRDSYATDTTAVGHDNGYNKYGNTNPVGGQQAYGAGGAGYGNGQHTGYATTTNTTTHAPYPHGGANELGAGDASNGYQRTHQPYNTNPTGTF